MCLAPSNASSTDLISPFTYLYAILSTSFAFWLIMIFAKGSSPFFLAVSAFVFLLFLNGKYKSSRDVKSWIESILSFKSDVKTPCSSRTFKIVTLRFSKASYCSLYLTISPIWTSSKFPVLSFLYREIKGMVQASLSNTTVFLTEESGSCVWEII